MEAGVQYSLIGMPAGTAGSVEAAVQSRNRADLLVWHRTDRARLLDCHKQGAATRHVQAPAQLMGHPAGIPGGGPAPPGAGPRCCCGGGWPWRAAMAKPRR